MSAKSKNFATKVIHGNGQKNAEGALATPIFQSSTFVFESAAQGGRRFAGTEGGYKYTRLGNPTIDVLEKKIAMLEEAEECVAFGSGMGAISGAVLPHLQSGDHLLADKTLYGCTFDLFSHLFPRLGIQVEFIDFSDIGQVKKSLRADTRAVYFETPANPNMKIIDLELVSRLTHETSSRALVITDNTFATPYLTQPLKLGADIVVHSATKYLNGHGDVVAGFACGSRELMAPVRGVGLKDLTGAVLGPFEAFLILRGLKTMKLRMDQHCANAMAVAKFLESRPEVIRVYFPGLASHPGHEIAARQMKQFGGMISFEVASFAIAEKMLDNLKLCSLAVSLGDCETLIQHPASMTHSAYTKEEREAAGFSDGLIRLSVGLEEGEDIIADLAQALEAAVK